MGDYQMLADGDRVLVAVSGGMDSLVLVAVLSRWLRKAPISYELHAIHVDMEGENGRIGDSAYQVVNIIDELNVPCTVVAALYKPGEEINGQEQGHQEDVKTKNICFLCARSRRLQLFDYASERGFNKLALGHHRDDLIETFFLNMLYGGNISTMVPKQVLFSGSLSIIRPLAYLDKEEVKALGCESALVPVLSNCPLEGKTGRAAAREILENICQQVPGARQRIFAAMGNVRLDYLLKNNRQ
jgi:tRNA 2-thiocytidine biosynthesis protein TtcA